MNRLTLTLLFMVMLTKPAAAWFPTYYDTVCNYWPNGQPKEYYIRICNGDSIDCFGASYDPFVNHGQYSAWYENGQLKEQGIYQHGMKQFTWIKWFEDGYRAEETFYKDDYKNGIHLEWYPNHDPKELLYYKNDAFHGLCTWRKPGFEHDHSEMTIDDLKFYLNGALLITFYEKGNEVLPIWDSVSYYNSTFDLWIEVPPECKRFEVGNKVDGIKQGLWTLHNQAGDILEIRLYQDGKAVEIK